MYKFGIAILMVIVCACGQSPRATKVLPDESQHHDEEVSQMTCFTEHAEFYIEYKPMVVGAEMAFLVHITDLDTYKPVTSGTLTIEMGDFKVTSGQQEHPGIFQVSVVPAKAGSIHISFTLRNGEVSQSVTDQVQVYKDQAEEEKAHTREGTPPEGMDEHYREEALGEIEFSKEMAWKNDFMVREIDVTPFSSVIPASGEILAVPGVKKSVAAPNNGVVFFSNGMMVQGSLVEKGQLLFTLGSGNLIEGNIELRLKESLNSLKRSRSEYLRHKQLMEERVISERQFLATQTSYNSDSLNYFTLSANATKDGLKIHAPVSGYIHELNVTEGEYIETGQTMVTISSNKELLLRADLPQHYVQQLKNIVTANFRPAYADQTYTIEQFNGRLLATGSSVAENNHYLPVYFKVENDGSLLEGAFAQFYLKTFIKEGSLSVPLNALIEEQDKYYLYVEVTGETYTKRAVTPGTNDGRRVEIIRGLSRGERVVTEGTMLVKAASLVTGVVGHGHVH